MVCVSAEVAFPGTAELGINAESVLIVTKDVLEVSAALLKAEVVVGVTDIPSELFDENTVFESPEKLQLLEVSAAVLEELGGALIVVVDPQANDMIESVADVCP